MKKNSPIDMEPGRYDLMSDEVYALIQEIDTEDSKDRLWESHERYIDIQIVLSGEERYGYAAVDQLVAEKPYDPEKDVTRYKKDGEGLFVDLKEGMFCIFFPQEGHKPCCCTVKPAKVKKLVFKVKLNQA